jgi:hypothetical protein
MRPRSDRLDRRRLALQRRPQRRRTSSGHSYSDSCGAIYDAGYDLGPGEVTTFEDSRVQMELLEAMPNGNYRIRVTRK